MPAFDYIIAGGGTAGSVLAARLTEDPAVRVLMLEAGTGRRSLMHRIPAGVLSLYQSGRYHWDYMSEPEALAAGRAYAYKMGKGLGGSSSINALLWVRGAPGVFDGWAEGGAVGWSWRDVEPLFRRIESFDDAADPQMGQSGPIAVARGNPGSSMFNEAFLEAGVEAGLAFNGNYNGPDQEGITVLHRNTRGGERSDVWTEYLKPCLGRPNLVIRCDTPVDRLIVEAGRVTGVMVRAGGRHETIHATGEVLLCAGAIGSPQLLMLSGIGDPGALVPHGIEVRHELPGVGANLHTHPTIRCGYTARKAERLASWTRPPKKWLAGVRWLVDRKGVASTNHMDVGCFLRSDNDASWPDIQMTFTPMLVGMTYADALADGFGVYTELVGIKSRGNVRLRSADPRALPRFSFNFLAEERDRATFRTGTDMIRDIVSQPAFDGLRGREIDPGASVTSPADIDRWVSGSIGITHHLAGTCRMGAPGDPRSVVGPDLRLLGLDGLRIADNSIMPCVTNGNTHAPAIMIGEKASDLITGERNVP